MLNGIGGRTIDEAKKRMSYRETLAWGGYIDRYGSLNLARRMEASSALIALQAYRLGGGEAQLMDFMPYERRLGVALEQAMSEWR